MATDLKCPECDGIAVARNEGDLVLHVCNKCGGIWFGNFQLKKVMELGDKTLDDLIGFEPPEGGHAPENPKFTCPVCDLPLHTNFLPGQANVQVHTCYNCAGIFMEAGALVELDKEIHKPGATPINPQLAEALGTERSIEVEMQDTLEIDRQRAQAMTAYLYGRYQGWGRPGIF